MSEIQALRALADALEQLHRAQRYTPSGALAGAMFRAQQPQEWREIRERAIADAQQHVGQCRVQLAKAQAGA